MIEVLDADGQRIEPGDRVVYAVKTRSAWLETATVVELVPYEDTENVRNPFFNDALPQTWGASGANNLWIRQPCTKYKVKFRLDDEEQTDKYGDKFIKPGSVKTLDDPYRFAVIKKA